MHLLALIYLLVLGGIFYFGIKKSPYLRWPDGLLAIFLLSWGALILTAHVLSLFSMLDVTSVYLAVSLVIAILLSVGLGQILPTHNISVVEWPCALSPRTASCMVWFLVGTSALVLICNLILAYGFLPANPDSIVYRFPRVYWYFWHHSLTHFASGGDPRPLYYPFNGTLAYLPLIHFRLGPRSFAILSLICWLVTALTTYLFARSFGAPRLAASATAWCVCLSPNILLQSLSTNDEIIAAAPMLAGLYFIHRWFLGRQHFDAVVGVVGVGVSLGTKLHATFYWPLLLAVGALMAFNYRAVRDEAVKWLNMRGISVIVLMVFAVGVFGFSFLAYNYFSSGHLMAWDLAAQVLNKPFDLRVALQTIILFTSQILLTPFADLHVVSSIAQRAQHYEFFNHLFAPLFTWVDNGPAYVSVSYRFTGINSPSSIAFNEYTLFVGFTWLIAIIAGARLIWCPPGNALWSRVHAASLPIWFITYAATSRYIEGFSVYLSYAVIVAGPALVYAFAPIGRPDLDRMRWVMVALVAVTHCFFALDVFLTSSPRNFIMLARAAMTFGLPSSRGFTIDDGVLGEIGRAKAGVVHRTIAWGQPYWAFMAYHPEIPQYFVSPSKEGLHSSGEDEMDDSRPVYDLVPPAADHHLYLYSFPKFPRWGRIAIRIQDKASPGLTRIGDVIFSFGPEWVFATGNDVEKRHPNDTRYIVITFSEQLNSGRNPIPSLTVDPTVYGLGATDDLSFRFELTVDGRLLDATNWASSAHAVLRTDGLSSDNGVLTVFVRNNEAGGTIASTKVVLRSNSAPESANATH